MRVFALMLVAAGCTTVHPATGPSGRTIYELDCSGPWQRTSDCLNEARVTCGGTFTILDARGWTSTALWNPPGACAFSGINSDGRIMFVDCNGLRTQAPDPDAEAKRKQIEKIDRDLEDARRHVRDPSVPTPPTAP